jgi:hypothetical protein
VDIVDLSAPDPHADRTHRVQLTDQVAAVLALAGFGCALASQWYGWFAIRGITGPADVIQSTSDLGLPTVVGMNDANTSLQTAYYLVWLSTLVCCGAILFVPAERRRPLFGAAVGSLAALTMIVLPVLRDPSRFLSGVLGQFIISVHASHRAGSYWVIAAIAVLAASLVAAVGGQVLPRSQAPRAAATPDGPARVMPVDHAAYVRPIEVEPAAQPYLR